MIHKGFHLAWEEIKGEVLDTVATLIETLPTPVQSLQTYLTGQDPIEPKHTAAKAGLTFKPHSQKYDI